ncbi:MAG: Thiol-disulfide isomerase or thioredoxin [Mucilaginibacter sp.]|uniref:TlpA family protein disulfide reductase n=1 Tax=Mucilaginibacter sp. TaxID=1882438 RepID=UPI00261B1E15|nr:TlpA disulfide reductase family protein [Mucilaginibacter sp.]MDB5003270.1 Thiol-disulfide isomerase or thioredoxin [Mucilaginibacter sp.]
MKTLSTITFLLTVAVVCFGQTSKDTLRFSAPKTKLSQKTASITFHMERFFGTGPEGNVSTMQGTLAQLRKYDDAKAFTVMKNVPTNLKDMQEYFHILDLPQFVFQSYVAGFYSKEYMEKRLTGNKFELKDTVRLSRQPLKCYVSAVSGMHDNQPVYMIDVDNDGDFANDQLRPALKGTTDEDLKIKGAVAVTINYLGNDNQIKDDKRLVFMSLPSYGSGTEMSFSFPEFNYLRFIYKGKPYMVATTNYSKSAVMIVPDRPYFDRIAKLNSVKIGQYAKIGDDEFIVSNIMNNGNDLVLTGVDISGFGDKKGVKVLSGKDPANKGTNKVSRQLGYKAPVVAGININPNIKLQGIVNTASLKGKYVFIDIWGTFCGPCIAEFPKIKEVYSTFSRKNLEIIGIVDDRQPGTTQQILKQQLLPWPNIQMDAKTSQTAGYKDINSYPTTYLLDPQGKIIDIDLRGEDLMNKLKTLIGK